MRGRLTAVVVLLTACGAPSQTSSSTATLQESSPTTTALPSSPTANAEASRLVGDIVVSPDTPPPGTEFNGTGDGQTALMAVVLSGRRQEFQELPGFVDGRFNTFSDGGGALLSLALLFDTDEHAEEAFDLFHLELVSDDGYGLAETPAALGDEGVCGEGPVPTPLGEETICIWRNGPLLLAAGGALADDGVHAAAAAMDARVRSSR
jgi:hypothetical protein